MSQMYAARPNHTHPCMTLKKRAKIFAPFAALTGLDDCIRERETVYVKKRQAGQEETDRINSILSSAKKGDMLEINHFVQNCAENEELGQYFTTSGVLKRVEIGAVIIDNIEIMLADIFDLRIIDNKMQECTD